MGPCLILSSPPATPGCLLQTPSREVGRGGKWVWDGRRWRRGGGSRDQRSREQKGQEAEEEKKKKTIDKTPAHSGCRRKPAKEIQRGRNKGEGETQQGLKQSHGKNKGKQKMKALEEAVMQIRREACRGLRNLMRASCRGVPGPRAWPPPRSGPSPRPWYPPAPRSLWGRQLGLLLPLQPSVL